MGFFFANPWGLLALAGLPAIVAIHMLRRKSRTVPASTLFLVEDVLKSREGGRRLRTPRTTPALWVQLAAATVLAMLLAAPRWIDPSSSLRASIVIDRSASMGAFRDEAASTLEHILRHYDTTAGLVEWTLLGSDSSPLATGSSPAALLAAFDAAWQPHLPTHDPMPAFRLARTIVGSTGPVVFLTDHIPQDAATVEGVHWVACGEPKENAAFLWASAEGDAWRAQVANYAPRQEVLRWRVNSGPWNELSLGAGATSTLQGTFPPGQNSVLLELAPDALPIDNTLPIIQPSRKPLVVQHAGADHPLTERVLRLAEPLATGSTPDLTLVPYDPLEPALPEGPAIIFLTEPERRTVPLRGSVVAENDPLMEALNWRGLIAADSLSLPFREGDSTLLWIGSRPAIFLRPTPRGPQLIFNFDIPSSNASRLPAFALLLHRFIEARRSEKIYPSADNVATGEPLHLAGLPPSHAPAIPELFTLTGSDNQVLFSGAAQFSDPRQSDLRQAASGGHPGETAATIRTANARGESLTPFYALLLLSLLLTNFYLTGDSIKRPARIDHTLPSAVPR